MIALLSAAAFFVGAAMVGDPGHSGAFWALIGLGLYALHVALEPYVGSYLARHRGGAAP